MFVDAETSQRAYSPSRGREAPAPHTGGLHLILSLKFPSVSCCCADVVEVHGLASVRARVSLGIGEPDGVALSRMGHKTQQIQARGVVTRQARGKQRRAGEVEGRRTRIPETKVTVAPARSSLRPEMTDSVK